MSNSFTDINKLAQGYVFSNYNSLFSGNRFLENSLSHVHSLRFLNTACLISKIYLPI